MSTTKRVEALEYQMWSKAEWIALSCSDEVEKLKRALDPLGESVFSVWLRQDGEAGRMSDRTLQIEESQPPIHPAFLPDVHEIGRAYQWAIHRSRECRELYERLWSGFIVHVRSHYDLAGGRLAVALQLYAAEIKKWLAQLEYIGFPSNAEDRAAAHVEMVDLFRRRCDEAGVYDDGDRAQAIWRQTQIEIIATHYGRQMSEADLDRDIEMWKRLDEDMAAGLPSSESEAARYLSDLFETYPRITSVADLMARLQKAIIL
jgi:hypothetical protein